MTPWDIDNPYDTDYRPYEPGWDDDDYSYPEPPEQQNNQKTPQQITNTAKNLVSSIPGKDAQCSQGVRKAFSQLFSSNELAGKVANDMVRYWQSSNSWQSISMSQAQGLANQGYFVVAGWINQSGVMGHVVVIVPGSTTYSGSWGAEVPCAMDIGEGKRWDSKPISNSFGSKIKNNVTFYDNK